MLADNYGVALRSLLEILDDIVCIKLYVGVCASHTMLGFESKSLILKF